MQVSIEQFAELQELTVSQIRYRIQRGIIMPCRYRPTILIDTDKHDSTCSKQQKVNKEAAQEILWLRKKVTQLQNEVMQLSFTEIKGEFDNAKIQDIHRTV